MGMTQAETESSEYLLLESVSCLFSDHVTPALLAAVERGDWPSELWGAPVWLAKKGFVRHAGAEEAM